MGKSLICGVGINDADYAITWYVHEDGKGRGSFVRSTAFGIIC